MCMQVRVKDSRVLEGELACTGAVGAQQSLLTRRAAHD